jgi:hypothetical protein
MMNLAQNNSDRHNSLPGNVILGFWRVRKIPYRNRSIDSVARFAGFPEAEGWKRGNSIVQYSIANQGEIIDKLQHGGRRRRVAALPIKMAVWSWRDCNASHYF